MMYALREEAVLEYITVERAAGHVSGGVGEAAVATSTWDMIGVSPGGSWSISVQLEHLCAVGASCAIVVSLQWEHLCAVGASLCSETISVQLEHPCAVGTSLCSGNISVQWEDLCAVETSLCSGNIPMQ